MSKIDTIFKIAEWKEETLSEREDGSKVTAVHVTKSYSGGLQGDGVVRYLMAVRGVFHNIRI